MNLSCQYAHDFARQALKALRFNLSDDNGSGRVGLPSADSTLPQPLKAKLKHWPGTGFDLLDGFP